ncbi:hypothetical protein [Acholeplasma granularum]|uniref:hypothetical protein n=1 Tax=Acholeplasma granularum TaxID=264635 RepID=UPI0004BCADEE|nr:hypothetical protein [Acholeplasma granularum]
MLENVDEKEHFFMMIDDLYRRLKTVDKEVLGMGSEKLPSSINTAILGYIASFGLSLIKDLYLNNTRSSGFLLSIRCIIEGIAIQMYLEKKSITPEQEEIFKLQSYLFEWDIYRRYPSFDDVLFDLNTINANYIKSKEVLIKKYQYTSKQIDKIKRSKVPYIDNMKSFEDLIKRHLPSGILEIYKTISLYVHPYNYRINDPKLFMILAETTINLLNKIFDNVTPSSKGLEYEYNMVIGMNDLGYHTRKITNHQVDKLNKLCGMIDSIGYNFLAYSIEACTSPLIDYLLDTSMGYTEQSTTKWKTAIENLWYLNECIGDDDLGNKNELIYAHTYIKQRLNVGGEVLDDDFMVAYDFYIKKYSNGVPYEVFKKNFIGTTGYTINEFGETKSLKKSVFTFIDEISPKINDGQLDCNVREEPDFNFTNNENIEIVKINLSDLLKMKYDESQVMSHASGYLYYSLSGAWYDGTQLAVLYEEILQVLLETLLNKLKELYRMKLIPKKIVNYLRNFINENKDNIKNKGQVYLMPKIKKDY